MIEADRLSRHFGGREAVRDITFSVAPGEVVAFLGPNGAGKTTTIRLLLGLLRPTAGRATVTRPVGYLPELFAGYDALAVGSYLAFVARMKGVARGSTEPALDAAGAAGLAGRPFGRLSKGQRQRVGLAQALLGDPPSYVLDEPTQGLDPAQVVDARALVRSLASKGAAVLLSTHLLAEAAAVADRVVVVVRGRVVAEERPGDAGDLERRFLELVGRGELT
ncbi:MAG TPA: ATP-binding cassette domain-containing protein [Acidimicrobiales bacterium]|nr:ATP-binding cassette domain-containing protein [Acidimicrobiales bacterium]